MKLLALAIASVLLEGCFLGCGSYSGNGDQVFARGADQLILCANDGFVVTLSGTSIEGKLETGSAAVVAVEGDTGQTVFSYTDVGQFDGLGSGWSEIDGSFTQAELDHAEVLCHDLTSRSWWTAP
jgi:hypothetical protein